MNLYDEFYPLVVEMLDEFGAAATLTGSAPAASNAAAKRAGRAVPTTEDPSIRPTRAVVGPVEVSGAEGRLVLDSAATMLAEPFMGETLTMAETSWTIGKVHRTAPQGKAIVFIAEVS